MAIFSKSNDHGHFFENLTSDLFNIVNDALDFPYRYHGWLYDKGSLLLAAGKIVP
jgi:hypothetical protein